MADLQQIGEALGLALLAGVSQLVTGTSRDREVSIDGLRPASVTGVGLAALGLLATLLLIATRRQ